jgi:hypothetical protein
MTEIDEMLAQIDRAASAPVDVTSGHDPAKVAELARVEQAGRDAARWSAGRGASLSHLLSHLPSDASPFDIEGTRGIQYLRREEGTFETRFGYCARVDLPGVLPRFVIHTIGRGVIDDVAVGPRQRFRHRWLQTWTTARTRAPDVLRAFDIDEIGDTLHGLSLRVALVPQSNRLSVLEVDVGAGNGRDCARAAEKALLFARIALSLVQAGATFAERAADNRPPAEQVEALVQRLGQTVSWISGPVARVGDGVEGRLSLDEQEDLPCALRVDLDGDGRASLFFRGPLKVVPERRTTLSPQEGFLDRLRALVDDKVGLATIDEAWVVDGDVGEARRMAVAEGELVRLRRLQASVELGPEGLIVRAPPFELDDATLLDAVGSSLSLWRTVVRRSHGLHE